MAIHYKIANWTNHNYFTYLLLKPHTDAKALQAKFPAWLECTTAGR